MATPMATFVLFILPAILALIAPPCFANDNNVLLTGQTLHTDQQLSYEGFSFIMQDDCNLVLYNGAGGWTSNTHRRGTNCTLTLDNNGQLLIKSGTGSIVWTSSAKSKDGKYAAVLHPDGKVVIYGPAVWSTHSLTRALGPRVGNTPFVRNLMFSGQVLYGDARLTTRNYEFVMQGDCNLVFYGGNWQSNTHGNGQHCFLRLDHQGMLSIKDDSYNTVWTSKNKSVQGDYVLVLQHNGRAVIYGPAIWSTKSSVKEIAMVTED